MTRFDKFLAFVCFLFAVVALDAQQVINGYRILVNVAAGSVSTPATGSTAIYVDSTTKKLATRDDTGTVVNYGAGGGGGGGYAGVNLQTTSYILTPTDSGKLVIMNCSTACTATLYGTPTGTYESAVLSIGSSVASISLNSLQFNGTSSAPGLISFRPLTFYSDGTNYFGGAPEIAGSGITFSPASNGLTVGNTLASPQSGRYFQLSASTSSISTLSGANTTVLWGFVATYSMTTNRLQYEVGTADNSADLYDIGVYDANGNLVCHVGATAGTSIAPSTGLHTIPWAASGTFTAGNRYYIGITGNATTFAIAGTGNGGQISSLSDQHPSSGNTTTGGVLNSSIGIPSDTFSSTNSLPNVAFY